MAISTKEFGAVNGTSTRFLSDFIIQSESHVRVYNYTGTTPIDEDLVLSTDYDLVDNAILFYTAPTAGTKVLIEVSSTPDTDFGVSLTPPVLLQVEELRDEVEALYDATVIAKDTATTKAGIATTKAGEASVSASSASTSAATATAKATIATEQADLAQDEANIAVTQANIALTAKDTAVDAADTATAAKDQVVELEALTLGYKNTTQSLRDEVVSTYDNFDDRYLGSKEEEPTLDNDGNALVVGALYYNSIEGVMKVYTGTEWIAAYASLSGALLVSNNLSDVSDPIIARANLEIDTAYTIATVNDFGTVPDGYKVVIVKDTDRGGTFIWKETGTANGGTIFAATGGCWHRQYSGAVNVKWFGAIDRQDSTTAFTNAINNSPVVYVPNETFYISTLTITTDIEMYGEGTLIHKASVGNNSMIKCLVDKKVILKDLTFDGNFNNQPEQTPLYFNFIWVAIGSLEMYNCTVFETKGHAIRTGNIDNFNASYFAHDVVIDSCRIIQKVNSSGSILSGDCIRPERTHGAIFRDNYIYGGYSGIRAHLYCKELEYYNNELCYIYPDVGITAALSENITIMNNNCHHNENHGYEIDAVVNCKVMNNISRYNNKSGFFGGELGAKAYADYYIYWGSISSTNYNGYNYSDQVYTSTYVPCYNTQYMYNISEFNKNSDTFNGVDGDVYAYNYINNPATKNTNYKYQLIITGGTINKTTANIISNTFVNAEEDLYTIHFSGYQFTANIENNKVLGALKPLSNFAGNYSYDYNYANRYLLDNTKRSTLLSDVYDSTSRTKFAVSSTTSGSTTYPFTIFGSAQGEKVLRIVARIASGTQLVTIDTNLHNSTGAFVYTLLSGAMCTLTTIYQEFFFRIVGDTTHFGNILKPQITIPSAGVTIYISEINIYTTIGDR